MGRVMITFKINSISVQEYLDIRSKVHWKVLLPKQAQMALDNSLYMIGAYDGEQLVGMGRIVGDGAVICYIQDLIVAPDYQRMGIGSKVLNALITYVKELKMENSQMMLCLMCAKGREGFYEQHGFCGRPTDTLGPGMIQYLE